MVYCNIDDVIDEAKVKPAFFGLATMEELQERVTKWAEEAKSLIDDYCNREFPDFPDEELPRLVTLASEEIIHNIISNRRVRQDGQYIRSNDWTLKTVPTTIFTDDIKGILKGYIKETETYNNSDVGFFVVTGAKKHGKTVQH